MTRRPSRTHSFRRQTSPSATCYAAPSTALSTPPSASPFHSAPAPRPMQSRGGARPASRGRRLGSTDPPFQRSWDSPTPGPPKMCKHSPVTRESVPRSHVTRVARLTIDFDKNRGGVQNVTTLTGPFSFPFWLCILLRHGEKQVRAQIRNTWPPRGTITKRRATTLYTATGGKHRTQATTH